MIVAVELAVAFTALTISTIGRLIEIGLYIRNRGFNRFVTGRTVYRGNSRHIHRENDCSPVSKRVFLSPSKLNLNLDVARISKLHQLALEPSVYAGAVDAVV